MGDTFDFLDAILPDEGWFGLFVLPDRRHVWHRDVEALARAAVKLDQEGKAVYHCNASFIERKRQGTAVAKVRTLWVDLDAGPGKPYASTAEAGLALATFVRKTGLPRPCIVSSGGGIHAYFVLDQDLDPDHWRTLSYVLKSLFQAEGLHADEGCTGDIVRVLRPPGTHNRKIFGPDGKKIADVGGPSRPVESVNIPYDIVSVNTLITILGIDLGLNARKGTTVPGFVPADTRDYPRTSEVLGPVPSYLRDAPRTVAAKLNVYGRHDASDPERITAACGQVSLLRDTRGNLPEPQWYAVSGVLGHCGEPGRTLFHQFSSGDPRYSHEDTERKLDQAVRAAGPTTCARFESLNAAPCLACPHRGQLTSPIELGRPRLPAAPAAAPKPAENILPPLPTPFFWTPQAKLAVQNDKAGEGELPYHIISEYPVYMSELHKLERTEEVSGLFRSWEPAHGSWTEFSLGLGEVKGDKGAASVARFGVIIDKKRWPSFVGLVDRLSIQRRGLHRYGTRYTQFGWKYDEAGNVAGFVIGDELRLPDGTTEKIAGSAEVTRRGKLMAAKGELRLWREAVEALFGKPGMEGHGFATLVGFASVLHPFTGAMGSVILHLHAKASGEGKSTALEAATSPWGEVPPSGAFMLQNNDTQVSKFISKGVLGNLPVVYEELRDDDTVRLKGYILSTTIGSDKKRAEQHGGGLRDDSQPWSNFMISTSNISLVDSVRSDGEEAHAARILEFVPHISEAARLSVAEGDRLRRQMAANQGVAGRAFVDHVLKDPAGIKARVEAAVAAAGALLPGTEKRFVVRMIACATVAGQICREAGILGLDIAAIMQWALKTAQDNAAGANDTASRDAPAVLGALMNDMLPHTLVVHGPYDPKKRGVTPALQLPRGALLARYELEGRRFYISIRTVRRWTRENHHSYTDVKRSLAEAKVLLAERRKVTLGAGAGLATGQDECWEIDGAHEAVTGHIGELGQNPESNVVPMRRP
jgi:hypothetical protein